MIATFDGREFLANLKAAARAAGNDKDRPHLACVRVELEDNTARFVATNGHWLWAHDTTCQEIVGIDEKGRPVIGHSSALVHIPLSDVRKILKAKPAKGAKVELDSEARTIVGVTFGEYKHTFPPYTQIVPETLEGKGGVALDVRYLSEICAAFEDVVDVPKGGAGIVIEPAGDRYDPAVITCPLSSALVVLMPRREDDRGEGTLRRYRRSA